MSQQVQPKEHEIPNNSGVPFPAQPTSPHTNDWGPSGKEIGGAIGQAVGTQIGGPVGEAIGRAGGELSGAIIGTVVGKVADVLENLHGTGPEIEPKQDPMDAGAPGTSPQGNLDAGAGSSPGVSGSDQGDVGLSDPGGGFCGTSDYGGGFCGFSDPSGGAWRTSLHGGPVTGIGGNDGEQQRQCGGSRGCCRGAER